MTERSIPRIFSIFFIVIFLLSGTLPAQTAGAVAPKTANLAPGLSAGDWTQIKALLPASAAATTYTQQAYLKASNSGAGNGLGIAMSLDGNTLVVGAPYECSNFTGVLYSGAAYVFTRNGGVWSEQAYLKASNAEAYDNFGDSVSLSGDTLVVGAHGEDSNGTGGQADNSAGDSGAAYVFTRSGTTWSQQAYLKASNAETGDNFGWVSISGNTLVVGAHGEDSNATGVNNLGQANNSASLSGAAYVFTRNGVTWSQQAYLKASNTGENDEFGHAVSLSGDTLVVGAAREDSNASGVNGNQGDNISFGNNSGAAYIFTRSGATWSQQAYIKASNTDVNDYFGSSVSVSDDTLVVGAAAESSNATGVNGDQANNSAYQSGAAYVFTRSGGTWSQQAYLKASNTGADDNFGFSTAVSSDTLVVGALGEDSKATGVNGDQADNSYNASGAVYVFTRSGITWSQKSYLKASNTDADDRFGSAVSVSGDTLVVGADGESSDATSVNGDQANNSAGASGAGYVFSVTTIQNLFLPFIRR